MCGIGRLKAASLAALVVSTVLMADGVLAASGGCMTGFASPLLVPITGSLGEVVIDAQCRYAYVTNQTNNRVEVVSLQEGKLGAPIAVGSAPVGLDTSPDGTTLYVANSGGNNISVVDLTHGVETQKIPVASGFSNDRPFSLAVASNGHVLFSTTFAGSGFGGRMMQWDPISNTLSQRTDYWYWGTTTEITFLKANADRSVIGIVAGDISSGPIFHYLAASDSFTPEKDLNAFVSYVALDASGNTTLVNPGTYVLDGSLNLAGTIPGGQFGVAVDPSGTLGYQVSSTGVDVLDLSTLLKTDTLALGDTVNSGSVYYFRSGVGHMSISRDGAVLAVITDNGLSLLSTGISKFVPMASLTVRLAAAVDDLPDHNRLALAADLRLGADSDGIDPATQPVTLIVGNVSLPIPAGSFHQHQERFVFTGPVGGVQVGAEIKRRGKGAYRLTVSGRGIDWTGTTIPPIVEIIIGDDQGRTTLTDGATEFHSN